MQTAFGLICALILIALGSVAMRMGFGTGLLAVGIGLGLLNIAAWAAPRLAALKVNHTAGATK